MKAFKLVVAVLAVLFASMVGATRVEAGDLFSGDSSIGRIIGAGAIGAGAGAVGGAILGKGVGPAKGAMAGAAIGAVIQGALELTDNVPISCGSAQPYQDPNTGQLYCGGGSPSVATPPFFPQQQYPQYPVAPAVYGGNTTIYTNEVIVVGGGRRFRPNPVYPGWVTPHVSPCAVTPQLCYADPSYQMNRFSGLLDGQDTARYNAMRARDWQRMERGIWQDELRDPAWMQGFQQGLYPRW